MSNYQIRILAESESQWIEGHSAGQRDRAKCDTQFDIHLLAGVAYGNRHLCGEAHLSGYLAGLEEPDTDADSYDGPEPTYDNRRW
ncbi:hypothetical protein [Mycobacterium avium]|uniref:hypothetical protein n=1 Tax=Mycobacterium avium TaxID=1764 RepID=UPI001140EE1C|nr:hypothetical protein [Mycobacterium avium]